MGTYTEVELGGRPAALWLAGDAEAEEATGDATKQLGYPFVFSWQKLQRYILGLDLGGDSPQALLPVAKSISTPEHLDSRKESTAVAESRYGAVIAHGLLCSRFDFAHVAEVLCEHGFTVIAPEMDDAISHAEGSVPGGLVGALGERRAGESRRLEVVSEAVAWLRERGLEKIALIGHSRGGVTISQMDGKYCRVNIAGFLPPSVEPSEGFHPSAADAPMYVICGTEDEVCTRPPLSLENVKDVVQTFVPQAEEWYPEGVGHLTVLDPRVREQWSLNLGLFAGIARDPPSEDFDTELPTRILKFLEANMDVVEEQ